MLLTRFITLGVFTFGVALNARCNNAKCNNLIVSSQNMFISLNSLVGVADAEMEKKVYTFNYLNAKITEIIYTIEFKSHEIYLT